MSILSIGFSAFILATLFIYYKLPKRFQSLFLVGASIFYYLFDLQLSNLLFLFHLALVYTLIIIRDNFAKSFIYKYIVIAVAITPLIYYKYGYFLGLKSTEFNPLGISFITFILVGYIIDTFKSFEKTKKSKLSTYLFANLFFPHVTSGPIARKEFIEPQINKNHILLISTIEKSLFVIILGIFQKFVIANRISLYTDSVFSSTSTYLGYPLLIAVYLFSFQLYFDFLAYSNIALGIARLFGFELIVNFKRPYLATSVSDFWRRWHISLSNWLRDYVYIGLGGNRKGNVRKYLNILTTFIISGIWHGSTALFIFWGILHGLSVVLESLYSQFAAKIGLKIRIPKLIKIILTFNFVTFLWIFFKTNSIAEYTFVVKNLFEIDNYLGSFKKIIINRDLLMNLEISFFFIIVFIAIEAVMESFLNKVFVLDKNIFGKIAVSTLLILFLLFFGVFGLQNFYYVRF